MSSQTFVKSYCDVCTADGRPYQLQTVHTYYVHKQQAERDARRRMPQEAASREDGYIFNSNCYKYQFYSCHYLEQSSTGAVVVVESSNTPEGVVGAH